MRFFLFLFLTGCAMTPLEQHIRSARDVDRLNDTVVESLTAYCSAAQTVALCAEYIVAPQRAVASALDAWVEELDRARAAGRWEDPQDGVAAANVGVAYDALAAVCREQHIEDLPPLPSSYCEHTGAQSCPTQEE
jgi:hypothetical protein